MLGPLVRPKGSEEGGDFTAPSISLSLTLALPLSHPPREAERCSIAVESPHVISLLMLGLG